MTSGPETGPTVGRRAELRQVAFRAARRHSLLVRVLRKAIPIGAAAAVLGLVVAPFLKPSVAGGNLSLGGVGIKGGKVVMELPKLAGYRKDNNPYEVTAQSALQDVRNPTQIELVEMKARIQTPNDGWVTVNARSGFFDQQKESLKLVDDVVIRTDTGYDVAMRTADINFKGGTVNSREPVRVSMGTTTVNADTLDVKDNGAMIVFEGRVRAVIENAPARSIAGPEREGSTPDPEAVKRAASGAGR